MSGNADVWESYLATCNEARWDDLGAFVGDAVLLDGTECTRDEYIDGLRRHGDCFADWTWTRERLVDAGDWLTVVMRTRGKHVGGWQGLTPNGAIVDSREIALYRFEDRRIVEVWTVADDLSTYLSLSSADPLASPDAGALGAA